MNGLLSADLNVEARFLPPPQFTWMVHGNHKMALRHARHLEQLTGDLCYVMWQGSSYFVIRFDPSGKEVMQM